MDVQRVPELFKQPEPRPCYLMGKCIVRWRLFLLEKSLHIFYFIFTEEISEMQDLTQAI